VSNLSGGVVVPEVITSGGGLYKSNQVYPQRESAWFQQRLVSTKDPSAYKVKNWFQNLACKIELVPLPSGTPGFLAALGFNLKAAVDGRDLSLAHNRPRVYASSQLF
jgi:hypothetical protein